MQNKAPLFVLGALVLCGVMLGAYLSAPEAVQVRVVDVASNLNPESLKLGANPGPDSTNPYECINGACRWYNRQAVRSATTTLCAIQSPKSATSTLEHGTIKLTVSTSTATVLQFAKATTAFATTTQIGTDHVVASGAQITVNASSSIFAPGEWFNIGIKGGNSADGLGMLSAGACQATFEQI
jgi:hypothetical protein